MNILDCLKDKQVIALIPETGPRPQHQAPCIFSARCLIFKPDRETARITSCGCPRFMELSALKVAGKVLIVDHMRWSVKLLIFIYSVTDWRFG